MRRRSVLFGVLPGLPMLPPSMLLMPLCLPPLPGYLRWLPWLLLLMLW